MHASVDVDRRTPTVDSPVQRAVHRAQFLMGTPDALERIVPDGWAGYDVGSGVVLRCGPGRRVEAASDADGDPWLVVGDAVTTAPRERSVCEELAGTATADVARLTHGWAGRWLLIGQRDVISDAGALLGCYWTEDATGAPVLSSSIALLGAVVGRTPSAVPTPRWHPTMVSAHVPPGTGLAGARKALPNQILDWRSGAVRPGPPAVCDVATASESERTTRFGAVFQRAVARLAALADGDAIIALTAGGDSRMTLAAALDAGVDVRTITMTYPEMIPGDRQLPPQLAALGGVRHDLIRPAHAVRRPLLRQWDAHTGLATAEIDRRFHSRGQFGFLRDGDVLLRSGCLETTTRACIPDFPAHDGIHPPAPATIAAGLGAADDPGVLADVAEWCRWAESTAEHFDDDWRVRLYVETRLGGWLSCVEQGLDLEPGTSLHPANCAALHAEGRALPMDVRATKGHQHELVRRWAPQLSPLPYNPPDGYTGRVRRRLWYIGRRVLTRPPRTPQAA